MAKALSIREVSVQTVIAAKRPLHVSEITRRVLERCVITSRTPEKTVNNALQKDPRVQRVGPGTFQVVGRR